MNKPNVTIPEALDAILAGGGREAVEAMGALKGVDYRPQKERKCDIRVMSANVEYVEWDETDPERVLYQRRMRLTAECVNTYMPDFVGLQECCQTMREPLDPHLDPAYTYVIFENPKPNIDYFPILYRADVWRVEDSGTGEYLATPRPWGYVWATFSRHSDPTDRFTVMNLHYVPEKMVSRGVPWELYWFPLAEELNRVIRTKLSEHPEIPIAVTGDYNAKRESELYGRMVRGLPMEDAGLLTPNSNVSEEETRRKAIDHITVSTGSVEVAAHRKLEYYPWKTMSDHWYYFADLHKKTAGGAR